MGGVMGRGVGDDSRLGVMERERDLDPRRTRSDKVCVGRFEGDSETLA